MLIGDLSCFSLCLACLLLLAFLFSCFCMCVLYNIIGLPFSFAFCLVGLFSLLSFALWLYAIVSAPCSGNAERQKQTAGNAYQNGGKGNARRACPALPDCLCCRCIIYHYARALLAGGYTTAARGVLFRYGLTRGKSQIGLAHPHNPLFSKSNILAHGYCYSSHNSLVLCFLITSN